MEERSPGGAGQTPGLPAPPGSPHRGPPPARRRRRRRRRRGYYYYYYYYYSRHRQCWQRRGRALLLGAYARRGGARTPLAAPAPTTSTRAVVEGLLPPPRRLYDRCRYGCCPWRHRYRLRPLRRQRRRRRCCCHYYACNDDRERQGCHQPGRGPSVPPPAPAGARRTPLCLRPPRSRPGKRPGGRRACD